MRNPERVTNPGKRRLVFAGAAVITVVLGLACRLAPLGLPQFLFKYGGSVLWAAAIYWVVAAVSPRTSVERRAVGVALLCAAVECFKLFHSPAVDGFRLTLAGKLLLGRYFSLWDIAAYWLAIGVAAAGERICLGPHGAASVPSRAASG